MLLTFSELIELDPEAFSMPEPIVKKYLAQANAFCVGYIGGMPPVIAIDENVKAAVAAAFELIAEGQSSQTNPVNGNITDVAPTNAFMRKEADPMALVKTMLGAAKAAYEKAQEQSEIPIPTPISRRGMVWLGGKVDGSTLR